MSDLANSPTFDCWNVNQTTVQNGHKLSRLGGFTINQSPVNCSQLVEHKNNSINRTFNLIQKYESLHELIAK